MPNASLPAAETPSPTFPSAEEMLAKCLSIGFTMRRAPHFDVSHPAVTLQPTPISRDTFATLCGHQLLWNEAVDRTARDFTFLHRVLGATAASDANFTGRLFSILEEVYLSGRPYQSLMLGIFRADYMGGGVAETGETAADWKNVEINTISCSFAGLAPLVSDFHQYLHAHHCAMTPNTEGTTTRRNAHMEWERSPSSVAVPLAMAAAVREWRTGVDWPALSDTHSSPLVPAVVVIVQEQERNTGDQYALLFELLATHGVLALRRTLQELSVSMQLHSSEAQRPPHAVLEGRYVMAVAYFRSTYVPEDFPTPATWTTRLALERSSAVKCPSVPYHLLTLKKLQQLLCDTEGVLTPIAFAGDAVKARRLQTHFMPQFSLNPEEVGEAAVAQVVAEAVRHPERFVLKPQLEGGGNLFAGEAMRRLLQVTEEADAVTFHKVRREYILMSRITFPVRSGAMFVNGEVVWLKENMCSELGVYGVVLSNGGGESHLKSGEESHGGLLHNACAGYVVRSKPADVEDGGVMSGVAALDSLVLV